MTQYQPIDEYVNGRRAAASCSLYEAAELVRDEAQAIMDSEKANRIAELRKRIDERKDAEKELAALKPVGAPRKSRKRNRRDLEAPVTA